MRLAYYISGHGMGHAVRSAVVANALRHRHEVFFVSDVGCAFLRETFLGQCEYRARSLDAGVAQTSPFDIDVQLTLQRLITLQREESRLLEEELEWLKSAGIDAVLTDIPALACEAAAILEIPAVAIANFSWDDIYRGYGAVAAGFDRAADHMARQYAKVPMLLELPFATPMPAFGTRRKMGLVARLATFSRDMARDALGTRSRYVGLLALNGPFEHIETIASNVPADWQILCPFVGPNRSDSAGLRYVSRDELTQAGLGFPDLVAASDVVISKPGYGITSECIANGAGLLYTDRGTFIETDYIVSGLRDLLPSTYIPQADLVGGHIKPFLRLFETQPARPGRIPALSESEICAHVEAALSVTS